MSPSLQVVFAVDGWKKISHWCVCVCVCVWIESPSLQVVFSVNVFSLWMGGRKLVIDVCVCVYESNRQAYKLFSLWMKARKWVVQNMRRGPEFVDSNQYLYEYWMCTIYVVLLRTRKSFACMQLCWWVWMNKVECAVQYLRMQSVSLKALYMFPEKKTRIHATDNLVICKFDPTHSYQYTERVFASCLVIAWARITSRIGRRVSRIQRLLDLPEHWWPFSPKHRWHSIHAPGFLNRKKRKNQDWIQ
jgi:hypothetical protein